jgi:hypothetical protein
MEVLEQHHDLEEVTAADIAEAHRKDLEVQDRYGVKFLTYWFDQGRGTTFCLIDAPTTLKQAEAEYKRQAELAKKQSASSQKAQ